MRTNNHYIGNAVRTSLLTMALLAVPASAATPDIMTALENAGVYVHQPSVVQAEGITIVKGKVANRSAVERASIVLRSLGLGRVANLLQVPVVPEDDQIRRTVEMNLTTARSLDGCRFNVTTQRGVVKLEGTVRDPLQRDIAVALVREVTGVRQVVNDLSVNS